MAYKRYFKRNGKTFGPYYYESYRDENGDVKKRYIGKVNPDKKKISVGKLVLGGLVLFAVIAAVLVSVQVSEEGTLPLDSGGVGDIVGSVKGFFSNSFSRIVGLVVSSQPEAEDGSASQDGSQQEVVDGSDSENPDGSSADSDGGLVDEEVASREDDVLEDVEIDVGLLGGVEEIDDEENESVEVETPPQVPSEDGNVTDDDMNVSEVVNVSDVVENVSVSVNVSDVVENVSDDEINDSDVVDVPVDVENVSEMVVDVEIKQYKAVVNRRVKWIQKVVVNESGGVSVEVPLGAEDIVIRTGEEVSEAEAEVDEYGDLVDGVDRGDIADGSITGFVARDIRDGKGLLVRAWEWIKGFTISGNVIDEVELEASGDIVESGDVKVVDLDDVVDAELAKGDEAEVAVEYYTEAPLAEESDIDRGVRVVVSADDALNYSDIWLMLFWIIGLGLIRRG